MKIKAQKTRVPGCVELISEKYEDERGSLSRIFDSRIFKDLQLGVDWTEVSLHHTKRKHTLRGLYVQQGPYSEGKLLKVLKGEMLWVSVDVRAGSDTFGKWNATVLSEETGNMLAVERGFAHGCVSLTDGVGLLIFSDNFFSAEHGFGIRWDDPELAIDWRLQDESPYVSERDLAYPSFEAFCQAFQK